MHFFPKKDIQKLEKYLGVKKSPGIHEKKLWKKVEKFTPYFSKIPGIMCVCVCNSLAMNACHKDSDIDLFIITQKNRIWTVRLYITLLLIIMGERKTNKKHAGKFCVSFFITENAMDFDAIAIPDDIYLSYWIQTLKPIINRENTHEQFMHINFPENFKENPSSNTYTHTFLGNIREKYIKTLFLPKTKMSFQKLGKPFGVIISDDMLKFHDTDKRREIANTLLK